MNLLTAKNITHTFEYELFSDVNLEVDEQDSIAIIGISGCGKSTLLHILSTLLIAEKGEVSLFGEPISSMNKKRLTDIKRNDLGLVFQSHYLFKGMSAKENLEVAAMLSRQNIDEELLKRLNIFELIKQIIL